MNISSPYARVVTISIFMAVLFSFTNSGHSPEANRGRKEVSIVYLGDDGRPMQLKVPYKIIGDDVIVQGDMIVGEKSSLEKNGSKFVVNFARSKYEDFEYKIDLDNSNGKQVVVLKAVQNDYSTNWPGGIVPIKISDNAKRISNIISSIDSFNRLMIKNNLKIMGCERVPY